MAHWKHLLVATAAMMVFAPMAHAQGEENAITVTASADATADREYEAAVRASLTYLRANPKVAGDYISAKELDVIESALRSGGLESYIARQDADRFAGAAYDVRLNSSADLLADLGSTIQMAQSSAAYRETLAGSAVDLPEPFRSRALTLVRNTRLTIPQLVPALTEVYEEAAESEGMYGEPATSPMAALACGVERGTPRTITDGSSGCEPNANGLLAKWDFPMKRYLGCVRDQGKRGSCVAFALTADIEMRAAMKRNQKYNLSEQFTYMRAELLTGAGKYRHGLPTFLTIKRFDNLGTSFGRETSWPYNPSRDRTGVDTRGTSVLYDDVYPKSCDNYSGYCTEVNFQGVQDKPYITSTGQIDFQYHHPPMNFGADNIRAYGRSSIIWSDSLSKMFAVQQQLPAKLRVAPVVASISVSANYMAKLPDGYLRYSSTDASKPGGHAVLIVGFVPKLSLPEGAPAPVGSGYFIVRNSWGTGRGDCGYEYIDEAWLRRHVTGLTTLGIK